jgi:hypothetical protein
MTPFMVLFIALTAFNVLLCTRLTESELIRKSEDANSLSDFGVGNWRADDYEPFSLA